MRKNLRAVLFVLTMGCFAHAVLAVESTWNYAVQVSSSVQVSPPQITLTWAQDTSVTPVSYTVSRKAPTDGSWGQLSVLPGTATSYTDTSALAGTAYEYQVAKNAGSYAGYGYVQTGINVPLVENRGKIVLIVDNTFTSSLALELNRLQQDLAGDGWTVLRHDVGRNDSVPSVKALIVSDYNSDPANVNTVFLFGHVPVPYSGQLNPDGHPDHVGAWPADVYYGNIAGTWTDTSVNFVQTVNTDPADAARLTNIPGDGKFDQTTIPSPVELQVGRVDLANMPGRLTWGGPASFPSELALLRQYLNKDHNFRTRITTYTRRGLVGDYFGVRNGEAFAASGYRSFAPFFGADGITNLNVLFNGTEGVWIPTLATNDYLWAYGCGAGSYSTIAGLGNTGPYNNGWTVEMVTNDVHAVFTLLFGSWLGDWDHEDNIMRSILATPTAGLTAAWSGRPHWFVHPMGLGETIGYCARLTQKNAGLYQNQINSSANLIHIALMGDPTLRLHPVAPPSAVNGTAVAGIVTLNWTPSADAVLGYHVYRSASPSGPFTRLTSSLVNGSLYIDTAATAGSVTYMVRAVKLESTPSGSYYNPSQGAFWGGGVPSQTPDTTPPSVSLTAPVNNASVSGTISLSANASDNVAVAGVQFQVDGANVGLQVTAPPFATSWGTTTVANGSHTVSAIATDTSGNQTTSSAVVVVVSNAGTSGGSGTSAWVQGALPSGASPASDGGDTWNWVTANPAPVSGAAAHQSSAAAGEHEHYFTGATTTLNVSAGDTLYAWVYLDSASAPSEVMLMWNDGSWEHRAYWGANLITYGANGTAGRYYAGPLPATGQWVLLQVPASAVGLEGSAVSGMGFSLYDGRATWDAAGKTSSSGGSSPQINIVQPVNNSVVSAASIPVSASVSALATVSGVQFAVDGVNTGLPVSAAPFSTILNTAQLAPGLHTLTATAWDAIGNQAQSKQIAITVTISPPAVSVTGKTVAINYVRPVAPGGMTIRWAGAAGKTYRVAYKTDLLGSWADLSSDIIGTGSSMSWTDSSTTGSIQRFYVVYATN